MWNRLEGKFNLRVYQAAVWKGWWGTERRKEI